MHKNPLWMAFLLIVAAVAFWFSYTLLGELRSYYALDKTTKPLAMEWRVAPKSSDRFYLAASYQYLVDDANYHGDTAFDQTNYRSPRAADQMLLVESKKDWKVWYSSKNPQESELQKSFPFKNCIYTAILWGLLLYFVGLSFYVGKFSIGKAGAK